MNIDKFQENMVSIVPKSSAALAATLLVLTAVILITQCATTWADVPTDYDVTFNYDDAIDNDLNEGYLQKIKHEKVDDMPRYLLVNAAEHSQKSDESPRSGVDQMKRKRQNLHGSIFGKRFTWPTLYPMKHAGWRFHPN